MPRIVKCIKLGQELPGIVYKPFNNELGQRIYDNVSQQAWMMWNIVVDALSKLVVERLVDDPG